MDQLVATVFKNGVGVAPSPICNSGRTTLPVVSSSRPEFTLLLAIAKVELPVGEQSVLQEQLVHTLDWKYLLTMAKLHGLEPLLFNHLRDISSRVIPDGVIQTLRDNCKVIALRNLILSSKLRDISAHLTSLQIEHISYKGPLLAEMYWGNCALRAFHDLDILVRQPELEAVRDALREIGFRDKYGLTQAQQAVSFRLGFEHPFTSEEGIDLDLHWRVVQEFKSRTLDSEGIWKRKTTALLFDRDLPTLSPEDLLVVLCLHAGHHGWTHLSHMCDIDQLFRVHRQFDWGIVRSHLGDSNTRRIVYTSLHLLQNHWQIQLPEDIAALVSSDRHSARLAHRIVTEIWPSERPTLTTSSFRWLLDRASGESFHDRLRLLAGSVFAPAIEDFAMFRLPPKLTPFYAGLRVLRLAHKSAFSGLRR